MQQRKLIAWLVFAVATCSCSGSPTVPSPTSPSTTVAPPAVTAAGFQPDARIYSFVEPVTGAVSWYTTASRFALNPDGTFVLQYPHVSYAGRYKALGGVVEFDWDGWSNLGPWGATGELDQDRLVVRFNKVMLFTDFEDAVYRLQP